MSKQINAKLAIAMIVAGQTSKALSKAANLSPTSLSLIRNNRRKPKPTTAARIAAALNTTPGALGWEVGHE